MALASGLPITVVAERTLAGLILFSSNKSFDVAANTWICRFADDVDALDRMLDRHAKGTQIVCGVRSAMTGHLVQAHTTAEAFTPSGMDGVRDHPRYHTGCSGQSSLGSTFPISRGQYSYCQYRSRLGFTTLNCGIQAICCQNGRSIR